ncbi:Endoplasmic reticulum-Golgi intermediate compartment protein 1 [Halotydeus destructor]|nr:Endoplasmic reticulum-Golgi intermediate compartment protein 1 [Halotydeus destructor]
MMAFDVRRFDIYRKVPKDLTQPTTSGAIISIACVFAIAFLLIAEFITFISPDVTSELFVESLESEQAGEDKIPVTLNITLPRLSCEAVGLDIQDDMGRHEVGFHENMEKTPINDGQGCFFHSSFKINRVPGNFHVSTHSAASQPDKIDMSHVVNSLTFGHDLSQLGIRGGFDPLKGKDKTMVQAIESHEYHMKIVPTMYEDGHLRLTSFQYTAAYKNFVAFSHNGRIMPAIWFRYDMTPITVKYTRRREPLYHFLTMMAAIIGGVFTVAGIIDSLVFTAHNIIKKLEIGKLS